MSDGSVSTAPGPSAVSKRAASPPVTGGPAPAAPSLASPSGRKIRKDALVPRIGVEPQHRGQPPQAPDHAFAREDAGILIEVEDQLAVGDGERRSRQEVGGSGR